MKRTASELSALMRLLDEVLELPESSRHSWLKSLSEADAAFAPSLEQLLLSHSPSTTGDVANLEHRIADFVRDELNGLQFDPQLPSARVGPYMLERQIGEGGMGSVWLAQRADGAFTLQVALKLPHATWQGQLAERMSRERDILAALQHENIARFLDAGFDAAGRPFLAMEYIEGVPLDVYCATHRVALIDRLQLTLQVAEALTYAHSKLVIHRDLKPNNILVTKDGRVKLLDFGVATLLAQDGTDKTRLPPVPM
jgi:serine/threonine-protein kinase